MSRKDKTTARFPSETEDFGYSSGNYFEQEEAQLLMYKDKLSELKL